MAVEIERKYLVVGDAWRPHVSRASRLRQGYLGGDRVLVRVRFDGENATLAIKSAFSGASRSEYEYPIPDDDAEALLSLAGPVVEKTRHRVEHEGHAWEVDVFEGANTGLVMAEIELTHVEESFATPPWVGAEVTDDVRYYNHHLAQEPYSRWSEHPSC